MSLDVDKKKRLNLDMKVKIGKMRRIRVMMKVNGLAPKNIDNTGKEEDVENDDEEGGQGEDEDAAAVVHPTVDRVITVPDCNVLCAHIFMQFGLYFSFVHMYVS